MGLYILIIQPKDSNYVSGVTLHETVEQAKAAAESDAEETLIWPAGFYDGQMATSCIVRDDRGAHLDYIDVYTIFRKVS